MLLSNKQGKSSTELQKKQWSLEGFQLNLLKAGPEWQSLCSYAGSAVLQVGGDVSADKSSQHLSFIDGSCYTFLLQTLRPE